MIDITDCASYKNMMDQMDEHDAFVDWAETQDDPTFWDEETQEWTDAAHEAYADMIDYMQSP